MANVRSLAKVQMRGAFLKKVMKETERAVQRQVAFKQQHIETIKADILREAEQGLDFVELQGNDHIVQAFFKEEGFAVLSWAERQSEEYTQISWSKDSVIVHD